MLNANSRVGCDVTKQLKRATVISTRIIAGSVSLSGVFTSTVVPTTSHQVAAVGEIKNQLRNQHISTGRGEKMQQS